MSEHSTIGDCLLEGTATLADHSPSAALDSELLLAHALDKPRTHLYAWPQKTIEPAQRRQFLQLIGQRAAGRPVAQLLGEREFWSIRLRVNEAVLTPRPDTETLVETALLVGPQGAARILDLGTGSGAIVIALASERPEWTCLAVDNSPAALSVCRDNVARLGLAERIECRQGDWYENIESARFDLIVSNPPYIRSNDPHLEQPELRFEPQAALVGGVDGLAAIRAIVAGARDHLRPAGYLMIEHGWDQAEAVAGLLAGAGLNGIGCREDLAGWPRVSYGQMPSSSEKSE